MSVKYPFKYEVMLECSIVNSEAEFPLFRHLLFIIHLLSIYYVPGSIFSTKNMTMKRTPFFS